MCLAICIKFGHERAQDRFRSDPRARPLRHRAPPGGQMLTWRRQMSNVEASRSTTSTSAFKLSAQSTLRAKANWAFDSK